jgi:hypothetical protein
MSLKNLKKKKLIVIFSDGSFLLTKNSIFQKIFFFEKDDRNCSLWLKLNELTTQLNNSNFRDKFLKIK